MHLPQTKTDAEMTDQERARRAAERAAIRAQIMADQRTNAKRDDAALEAERAWFAARGAK